MICSRCGKSIGKDGSFIESADYVMSESLEEVVNQKIYCSTACFVTAGNKKPELPHKTEPLQGKEKGGIIKEVIDVHPPRKQGITIDLRNKQNASS